MKIVISGFYGLHNTGDEAILQAMIQNLRVVYDNPEITVFSLSPTVTAQTHQVRSFYRGWRRDNREKIKALKEADVLLSGGGGLLQDTYPTKFLFGPLPYYLLIVLLAKLVGTPVMFFSQGIGPVTSKWGKFLMRRLANKADYITVRDEHSKQELKDLRVTKPQTTVTADVVFTLQTNAAQGKIAKDYALHQPYVVFAPRPWFDYEDDYMQAIAEIADELYVRYQLLPVFLPMERPADVEFSKKIIEQMKYATSAILIEKQYDTIETAACIQGSELTIALRLHALIFAALGHVPHIGLSYDPKVEAFLKRSSMWPYSFPLEQIDRQAFLTHCETLLDPTTQASEQIARHVEQLHEEAMQNFVLLKKHFK